MKKYLMMGINSDDKTVTEKAGPMVEKLYTLQPEDPSKIVMHPSKGKDNGKKYRATLGPEAQKKWSKLTPSQRKTERSAPGAWTHSAKAPDPDEPDPSLAFRSFTRREMKELGAGKHPLARVKAAKPGEGRQARKERKKEGLTRQRTTTTRFYINPRRKKEGLKPFPAAKKPPIRKGSDPIQGTQRFYRVAKQGSQRQMKLDQQAAKHESADTDKMVQAYRGIRKGLYTVKRPLQTSYTVKRPPSRQEKLQSLTQRYAQEDRIMSGQPPIVGGPKISPSRAALLRKEGRERLSKPAKPGLKQKPRFDVKIGQAVIEPSTETRRVAAKPWSPKQVGGGITSGASATGRRLAGGTKRKPPMMTKAYGKWGRKKKPSEIGSAMSRTELYPLEQPEMSKACAVHKKGPCPSNCPTKKSAYEKSVERFMDFGKPVPPKREGESDFQRRIRHHMHHLGEHPGGREQAIAIAASEADVSRKKSVTTQAVDLLKACKSEVKEQSIESQLRKDPAYIEKKDEEEDTEKALTTRNFAMPRISALCARYDANQIHRSAMTQTSRNHSALAPLVADTLNRVAQTEPLRTQPPIRKNCLAHGLAHKSEDECPACLMAKSLETTRPDVRYPLR